MSNVAARLIATRRPLLWFLAFFLGTASLAAGQTQKGGSVRLAPDALFTRISPSVFVVEALDVQGNLIALGSGVAVGKNLVVTNKHVISEGVTIRVSHGDRQWMAIDAIPHRTQDLTLLFVAELNTTAVTLRDGEPRIGERAYAIGSPQGLELTLSDGLISGIRELRPGTLSIQTSASISPGSSGGGLFDEYGRLIGITTFRLRDSQNLNFAIPVRYILELVSEAQKPKVSAPERTPVSEAQKPKATGCDPKAKIQATVNANGRIVFTNIGPPCPENEGNVGENRSPVIAAEPDACKNGIGLECIRRGMTYEEMIKVVGIPEHTAYVEGFEKYIYDSVKFNYGTVSVYFRNHVVSVIKRETPR